MKEGLLPGIWSLAARAGSVVGCLTRVPESTAVHLTFDDGPDPATTPRLLDFLASRDVLATFFLTGQNAARHLGLMRRIHSEGHKIGQHGFAHLDPWRTIRSRIRDDFRQSTDIIEDATGERIAYTRPPYGHVTPDILRWARENRQRVVLWDVMPGDFIERRSVSGLAAFVVRRARTGSIVVLHEGGDAGHRALDAIPEILESLAARGLNCEPLP